MPRPEHVACVTRNHLAHHGESWCGRRVGMEFVFITLDHAAENGAAGGRLTVCPECLKAAVAALSNGVGVVHAPKQADAIRAGAMLAWNTLDAVAQKLDERVQNDIREFLMRAWHHNVLPALDAAAPKDGVAVDRHQTFSQKTPTAPGEGS